MDSLSLNAPDALVCAPTEKCRVPPMPIRFRCAYCNQLMGIARRKAGTVVRCPKCAGQVVVPQPEGPEDGHADDANAQDGSEPAGVFENSDFGKIFDHGAEAGRQGHPPAVLPAAN